jgi:hypothetical protein
MTPLKQLIRWVIEVHGGRVHRDLYHAQGIALGCPPPARTGRSARAIHCSSATDTSASSPATADAALASGRAERARIEADGGVAGLSPVGSC